MPRPLACTALLLAATASAPSARPGEGPGPPPDALRAHGIAGGSVQAVAPRALRDGTLEVRVALEGRDERLVLRPRRLVADGWRVLAGSDAAGWEEVRVAAPRTYAGSVAGRPGSAAVATLVDGGLRALARLGPDGPLVSIQPLRELDAAAAPGLHAVHRADDVQVPPAACGTEAASAWRPPAPAAAAGAEAFVAAELAVDADFEFFERHGGSVQAVVDDVTSVLLGAELIYQAETAISFELTAVLVETVEPDPYASTDPGALLNELEAHWNAAHAAVPRDLAQLFTGKALDGPVVGIANLNTICDVPESYSVVESLFTPVHVTRVALSAHEIGHNFGAVHCDGQPDCAILCSVLGACPGGLTQLGAVPEAAIEFIKSVSPCLDPVAPPPPPDPPVVTSVVPAAVPAFQPGVVLLHGSGLAQVTEVHVGDEVLVPPFGAVVLDDATIQVSAPAPAALGPVPVVAVNAGGASAPVDLAYEATEPPQLAAPGFTFAGATFAWTFGSEPGEAWFLFLASDPTLFPLLGFDLLAGGVLFAAGALDAAGLGEASTVVPAGLGGATVYGQLVALDPLGAFAGASGVAPTVLLF